jgi:hypothetical protein
LSSNGSLRYFFFALQVIDASARKIWRATDEACLERARHAIMRVAMHVELSHFGIVGTEHHGVDFGCRTSEAGFKSSFLGAHDPKHDPQEIPERFGDYPREIPGAVGDQSPESPEASGIFRGSRTLSPLDLGIESKMLFSLSSWREPVKEIWVCPQRTRLGNRLAEKTFEQRSLQIRS